MGTIQKSGLWTTVVNYTGAALGFVCVSILFPKFLEPDQVGLTNTLKIVAAIFAQFSCMGCGNVVLRFFPFFRSGERAFNGIFTLTFLISLAGIAIFTILFIVFKPAIISYYEKESSLFIQYAMLIIPIAVFLVFHTLFSAWLRSLMKIIIPAIFFEIILRLLFLIVVFIYVWNDNFEIFITLYAFCYAVPAVGLFIYLWRCGFLSFRIKITPHIKQYFHPAIKYGLFCLFTSMGTMLVGYIDSIMLGGMIGLASVAVYTLANNFINVLAMPYRSFSAISAPMVAEYWQKNDMKSMKTIYQKFTLNIVIVSSLLFLLIWLNLDSFYLNMPEVYAAGKWAFLILFIGKFFDITTGLNTTILSTSKKYVWDLYFAAFLIIAAVATNMLFIPLWGINGAALATTICVIVLSFLRVLAVKKFFHIQPLTNKVWIVLLLGVAVCVLITFIPRFLHWTLDIVMRSGLVVILFLLPVYLLKISDEINGNINRVLKMFFPKLKIR